MDPSATPYEPHQWINSS